MAKAFLKPEEAERILKTYSKSFKDEFYELGPYTYQTSYLYTITLCPELTPEGKNTGRILVNHYSMYDLQRTPDFIDVWIRKGKDFRFLYRNLPKKDMVSAEERVKILEEELEGIKQLQLGKFDLKGKKAAEIKYEITKIYEECFSLYNHALTHIHSRMIEENTFFRETEAYWGLIEERDEALLKKKKAEDKLAEYEARDKATAERLLAYSKLLEEHNVPLPENVLRFSTHNARGAGRKKDPMTEVKRKKAIRLKEKGLTREEICKELDIGQTTYYRYISEDKDRK